MGGLSAVGGASALSNAQFAAQYQVAVLKKQLDATKELGNMALQLIQSSAAGSNVGQQLNITA